MVDRLIDIGIDKLIEYSCAEHLHELDVRTLQLRLLFKILFCDGMDVFVVERLQKTFHWISA